MQLAASWKKNVTGLCSKTGAFALPILQDLKLSDGESRKQGKWMEKIEIFVESILI